MQKKYRGRVFREDEYAKCPWYKEESIKDIRCQGLCSSSSDQKFKTEKAKNDYKYSFCCGFWENCEQSIALTHKEEYEHQADKKAGRK